MSLSSDIAAAIGWLFPVMSIVLIILAAVRPHLRGRGWLIGYLGCGLVTMLAWRVLPLIAMLPGFDGEWIGRLYRIGQIPLNLISLAGMALLIPFILVVSERRREDAPH